MKKSTVIAKCLVNSGFFDSVIGAEKVVERIFIDEGKPGLFSDWNSNIGLSSAEHIIQSVGRASTINVSNFIDDLTDNRGMY